MQKRWKIVMTLVLALMMLMTSVCAEVDVGNTVVPPAQGAEQVQNTPQPDASESSDAVAPVTGTPTPEPAQDSENVQETPAPTGTPAATSEPTEAPETDLPADPMVTPAPDANPEAGDDAEQDESAGEGMEPSVEIDPEGAEDAAEAIPEVTPEPEIPKSRGNWVAMNISMRDMTDKRAAASQMMAKYLLARSVADGVPVGVYMMRSSSRIFKGAVTNQAEWDNLMKEVSEIVYRQEDVAVQFKDFMTSLMGEDLKDVDLWLLANDAHGRGNLTGKVNISNVLNSSGLSMTFMNFRREKDTLDRGERWLYEQVQDLQVANFTVVESFDYEKALEDPIRAAMDVFGLNLLAPETAVVRDEETGDILWNHAGMDTLLVLTTDGKTVTVAADEAAQGGSFPLVIQMADDQYMVLLRKAAPGMYRIAGDVKALTAAYCIDNAELMLEGASGEPMDWYLDEQELIVSLNVPQVFSEHVELSMYINGVRSEAAPAIETSDETGHRWKFAVMPENLLPLSIQFEARVGDFAVNSPVYLFRMVDRPLELAGEDSATFTYYYNVPGQEEAPLRVYLADQFNNKDRQTLHYQPESEEYTIEEDTLVYHRGENAEDKAWTLQVDDGASAPVAFTVNVKHVDFMAAVQEWRAQADTLAYAGELGKDTLVTFKLPGEYVAFYAAVREQYQGLSQSLEEALRITATLTDQRYPDGTNLDVTLSMNEEGGLTVTTVVPAYQTKQDNASVTFRVEVLGQAIADQQMAASCTLSVANDIPALADENLRTLEVKAGIKGAPGKREPLTFAAINEARKEGETTLPVPFVPAELFVDEINLEGLTVTIKAEPAALVRLVRSVTDPESGEENDQEISMNEQGAWVIEGNVSNEPHELYILDKGVVTVTITANDGENEGADVIGWTLKVISPYDTMVLIASISAAVLVILVIVLLVLRQIKKPSFARMNSVMNMRVTTSYSPNPAYTAVPMAIYGKKETDLAKLFIACQQTPLASMPVDMLADVAIHPGKRRSFRIVLGKRAEKLNIVVGGQAQNTQKPVVFNQDQQVNVYTDMNEVLYLQISSGR